MRLNVLVLLGAAGCGLFDGKEEVNGPSCEDTPTVITAEEVSALGFAAADVLAFSEGAQTPTFTWTGSGATTAMTLTLNRASDGEVRFVDSEAVAGDTGMSPAIWVECTDRVEVDMELYLSTEDGVLDWVGPVVLVATEASASSWSLTLAPEDLATPFPVSDYTDTTDYDEVALYLDAAYDASGTRGALTLHMSGSDDDCVDGDDCTAWASQDELGTWGAATE